MQSELRVVNELVQAESQFVDRLFSEISKVIVGQKEMVEGMLIGMLSRGHVLVQGVPGLAKTLTVKTLADSMAMNFSRVQFTPDLLPADIIGTSIYHPKDGEFSVKKGPIFANIVLADEINRAPAKVQSALLESMQERQVTIGDQSYPLPEPFLVMATQNPIEQEGTYSLPEAQLDRFMLMIKVGYPTKEEERQIMDRMTSPTLQEVQAVVSAEDLKKARDVIHQIYVDEKVRDYIVDIIAASRAPAQHGLIELSDLIEFGASPRASIALLQAARAHAFIRHRGFVIPDDIKAVAPLVLRHRVILSYEAEAENIQSEDVIQKLFEQIEVP